jgi:hypothetical protein
VVGVVIKMAAGWSAEQTSALLGIWGDDEVQAKLDGVVRNKSIYQSIASQLVELGYEKTWKQCKVKIKNLIQRYKKVSCNIDCRQVNHIIVR